MAWYSTMPRLETARKIASLGFKLLRCKIGTKIPVDKDWPSKASNDHAVITYWFELCNIVNFAILTESIVVVDVESEGIRSFSPKERISLLKGDESGPTPWQRTPNGGYHFFFRAPDVDPPWKTLVNVVRPGVDIKTGARSCVMCEPSFLADEETLQVIGYWKFETPLREIQTLPQLPDWLYREIETHQSPPCRTIDEVSDEENADKPCMYYFKKGQRNNGLTHLAGKLRYYYQIRDVDLITQLLLVFNDFVCDPPLPKSEVQTIAKSVSSRPLTRLRRQAGENQLAPDAKISQESYERFKQALQEKRKRLR